MLIMPSVWGSIVAFTKNMIGDLQNSSQIPLNFIDWDAHANMPELPDTDIMGPTAFTMIEHSPQIMEVSFAIAVSTYQSDTNLFRLREYVSYAFEKLRVGSELMIWDSETVEEIGFLKLTDGTAVLPMSRSTTRPYQYVQTSGLLQPSITSEEYQD